MPDYRKKIKFRGCPIEKHKGENWEKISLINLNRPVVLKAVQICRSDDFYIDGVEFSIDEGDLVFDVLDDTFRDFSEKDWQDLLTVFYGRGDIIGLVLLFKQDNTACIDAFGEEYNDYFFTTFRAYEVKKHSYYERMVGKQFWVIVKREDF